MDWTLRDVNVSLSRRKNVLRKLLRIPYRLRLFVSFCESSDWDWMKYTRCERLPLLVQAFVVVVVVVVFSSPENYFGFRTTNVSVKTDHSVSRRKNKTFWTFPIVHSICELILCPVLRLLSPDWIKTRLYSVISSYGEFFTCPDLFTFAEPALSLSYVKTVLNANAWEWTNLSA